MAEKGKAVAAQVPAPEAGPAGAALSPEKLAEQRARAEALGVLKPPHVERALEARNRPSQRVIAPSFGESGDFKEVRISKPISWCPGGGTIGVHFPAGTKIAIGSFVAGKMIDQADLQSLVDAGYAEVEALVTVRYLRKSDLLVGSRVHAAPYGKLFTVPKRLADILCRRDGSLNASAEMICEGQYTGDLSTLPPCPPPARYQGQGADPDAPAAYCRFKWTQPAHRNGMSPGSVEWIDERQAVDYALQGRGEIVSESELSPEGREYQAAQSAKPRVPIGKMFFVANGAILP